MTANELKTEAGLIGWMPGGEWRLGAVVFVAVAAWVVEISHLGFRWILTGLLAAAARLVPGFPSGSTQPASARP